MYSLVVYVIEHTLTNFTSVWPMYSSYIDVFFVKHRFASLSTGLRTQLKHDSFWRKKLAKYFQTCQVLHGKNIFENKTDCSLDFLALMRNQTLRSNVRCTWWHVFQDSNRRRWRTLSSMTTSFTRLKLAAMHSHKFSRYLQKQGRLSLLWCLG